MHRHYKGFKKLDNGFYSFHGAWYPVEEGRGNRRKREIVRARAMYLQSIIHRRTPWNRYIS